MTAMGQREKEPAGGEPSSESVEDFMEDGTGEVKVTDRQRVGPDGDTAPEEQLASDEVVVDAGEHSLRERLAEAESKRLEAERQVVEFADRFRKAQTQMRVENHELRLRLQRNFEQKLEVARGDLVASLLDSLDNLQRAVTAAESSEGREKDVAALIEGIRATADLFESQMKSLGLSAVESLGAEFNPEVHEAVEIVPGAPEDDNRVVAEMQPGYRLGERLLRPARVRVGRSRES